MAGPVSTSAATARKWGNRVAVYLLHFERKFHHAQHYIGFTELAPEKRLERHLAGDGSRLVRAVRQAGIGVDLVRVWPGGGRALERQLKKRKKAAQLCPACSGEGVTGCADDELSNAFVEIARNLMEAA